MIRTQRHSWMPNGWFQTDTLEPGGGGSHLLTVGCPDDFTAVRVGLANASKNPWKLTKLIACASASWGDYTNPVDEFDIPLCHSAWQSFTSGESRADRPPADSPQDKDDPTITIEAAQHANDSDDLAWTFTDWLPLASRRADPATGMRILMLRAAVPSGQTVTFANGRFEKWYQNQPLNHGYDIFMGGAKFDTDLVNNTALRGITTKSLFANNPVNGCLIPMVQFLTKHPGIVGMTTGDSHHMGSSTTTNFNSYLAQSLLPIGETHVGSVPIGMVNSAVGGMASKKFFHRLHSLLPMVQPSFVVLPGWTFNDRSNIDDVDSVYTAFFLRLRAAADDVITAGGVPIFLTPFPRDAASMTLTRILAWRTLRDRIIVLRNENAIVVDSSIILGRVTAGELVGTYKPEYTDDGVHPNDAGHSAVAVALAPVIREICDLPQAPPCGP